MKSLFQKIWPKKLYAQLVVAAAIALFVAQTVNGVLLFNGLQQRAAFEAGTQAVTAFIRREQRIQSGREIRRGNRTNRPDRPNRRRRRGVVLLENQQSDPPNGFRRDDSLSERAINFIGGEVVERQPEVAVYTGGLSKLPTEVQRRLLDRPVFRDAFREGKRLPKKALILSVRRDDGSVATAISAIRPIPPQSLFLLFLQTLLLYIAVLIPLIFIARRISGPLSHLRENIVDFSERKQPQPVAASGPQDVHELIVAYNGLQERISQLLSEKDVMLGAIGHDLKTPLASLRIRAENVDNVEEREAMADTIEEMSLMLDDILTLARLGNSAEEPKETDIVDLLKTLADEYRGQQYDVGLAELPPTLPLIVRPMLLRRALRNILDNALRYGNRATIDIIQEESSVAIEISDDGPGIPEHDIKKMFEPFERGDASRNKASGGSGLGLTIARAILRLHGGELRLKNRPEGGLSATLYLN